MTKLTIAFRNFANGSENVPQCHFNLYAPCILYIGQPYRYSREYAFYIFSQQIHIIIFLDFLSPSSFILPQHVVYFLMLPFLVHKIFTFYINNVLNCKCPAPEVNISDVGEVEAACSVSRWQCMFLFNDIRLQELVVPKQDKSIAAPKILTSQQGKLLMF